MKICIPITILVMLAEINYLVRYCKVENVPLLSRNHPIRMRIAVYLKELSKKCSKIENPQTKLELAFIQGSCQKIFANRRIFKIMSDIVPKLSDF